MKSRCRCCQQHHPLLSFIFIETFIDSLNSFQVYFKVPQVYFKESKDTSVKTVLHTIKYTFLQLLLRFKYLHTPQRFYSDLVHSFVFVSVRMLLSFLVRILQTGVEQQVEHFFGLNILLLFLVADMSTSICFAPFLAHYVMSHILVIFQI